MHFSETPLCTAYSGMPSLKRHGSCHLTGTVLRTDGSCHLTATCAQTVLRTDDSCHLTETVLRTDDSCHLTETVGSTFSWLENLGDPHYESFSEL